MNIHLVINDFICTIFVPQKLKEFSVIFGDPKLVEHLLNVAGDCNLVFPESAEEPCQIVVEIRSLK